MKIIIKPYVFLILILAEACIGSTKLMANEQISSTILNYGIIKSETFSIEKTPETTTGTKVKGRNAKVVKTTDKVPAELGIIFGFEYQITGLQANEQVELSKVVIHPTITKPNGSISTGYTTILKKKTDSTGKVKSITGSTLYYTYELIPGTWAFKLYLDNEMIIEKAFTVY